MAVERREGAAQLSEVEDSIDAAQQVIARNVIVEIEGLEESVLPTTSLTHHLDALPSNGCHQHRPRSPNCQRVFQQN